MNISVKKLVLSRYFSDFCNLNQTNKLLIMGQILTKFDDGSYLEYDRGRFDKWCVYLSRPNQAKYAPSDSQYFNRLQEYANTHFCF